MWNLIILTKVKKFDWLLIHEKLHTRVRLSKFIQNEFAKEMRNRLPVNPWSNNDAQINDIFDQLELINNGECNGLSELSKALLNCWKICNDRNNKYLEV